MNITDKQPQQIFTWESNPPEKSGKYTIKDKYGNIRSDSYIIGRSDLQDALWKKQGIKWLYEQQGIILSVEEWEKINGYKEALEKIRRLCLEFDINEPIGTMIHTTVKQALSQLK